MDLAGITVNQLLGNIQVGKMDGFHKTQRKTNGLEMSQLNS